MGIGRTRSRCGPTQIGQLPVSGKVKTFLKGGMRNISCITVGDVTA